MRLVSDEIAHEPDEDEDLAAHNPEGARSIAAGQPLIEVEEGRPPARPLYFAEAYVPVVLKGKTIAIIEVYVDQTEKRSDYRSTFVVSTLALGALVALAFSVPAVAWRRRTLEKRVVDDRIRFLALHDSLTGLPNRVHLVERIGRALIAQRERGGELALHAIDIDRFKDINDTLGHETGDALIRAVAERLSVLARTDDIVARLGGDEFIVLQTRLVATDCPLRFGRAIVDDLARPYAINGHFVGVTASVGVAIGPQHGADAVRLMKSADLALYRSKADGR